VRQQNTSRVTNFVSLSQFLLGTPSGGVLKSFGLEGIIVEYHTSKNRCCSGTQLLHSTENDTQQQRQGFNFSFLELGTLDKTPTQNYG
jgi:hypothetical protein